MSIPQSMMPIMQALAQLGPQVSQMGPAAQVQNVKFQQPTRNPIATGAALGLGTPPAGGNAGPLQAATLAYANTQSQRMPGAAGAMESLWDAFREKGKRAELAEQTQIAADQAAQKEAQEKLKAQEEAIKRGDAVYKAVIEQDGTPEEARQAATLAQQDPKIAENLMKDIGGKLTREDKTEATRSREQRLEFASTPEGKQLLGGMSPAERRIFLATGQQVPKGTTINQTDIPTDHRAIYDDQGRVVEFEVIPGSKTDRTMQAEEIAAKRNWRNTVHGAERVVGDAKHALNKVGISTTGPIGQVLAQIPGTEAANLQRVLDTIKANVGFDRLQQMRQASITGGALGNVSNREIELLYNSMAPLGGENAAQMSPAEMKRSLATIIQSYERLAEYSRNADMFDAMTDEEYYAYWDAKGMAPEMAPLESYQQAPTGTPSQQALRDKYIGAGGG